MSQSGPPPPLHAATTSSSSSSNSKNHYPLNRFNMSLPIAPPPTNNVGSSVSTSSLSRRPLPVGGPKPKIPNRSKDDHNDTRRMQSSSQNPGTARHETTAEKTTNKRKRKKDKILEPTTEQPSSPEEASQETLGKGSKASKTNGFGQIITAKMGKFSSSESQIIQQAVRDYCTEHNLTIERLCSSEIDARSEEFRGVWLQISQKLPHRTTRAVYRHAMRVMHPFKRGEWTEEETRELMLLVVMHGKKWVTIQNKLNRAADSCRDKYREFHTDFKRGEWGEEETLLLEKHVRDVLKFQEQDISMYQVEEMIQKDPEKYHIPWDQISKLMGNRSRLACFRKYLVLVRAGKHGNGSDDESSIELEVMSSGKTNKTKPSNLKRMNDVTTSDTNGCSKNRSSNDIGSRSKSGSESVRSSSSEDNHGGGGDGNVDGRENNPTRVYGSNGRKRCRQETASSSNAYKDTADGTPPISTRSLPSSMSVKNITSTDECDSSSYDRQLLRNLATSSYSRDADVNWSTMRYPLGNAQERWQTLVDEWIQMYGIDEDEVMDKPIWEVAKEILNQGMDSTEMDPAELAARTVEAVFLF
jgi:Myb superfamily proteins, including transcription factors and mRNA splicing factors